jgi:3-oxoacyl-[acyl-carrier protein] reductase
MIELRHELRARRAPRDDRRTLGPNRHDRLRRRRYVESMMAAYCGAKAGAAGFGRGIAREVGRYGITVNSIALAHMHTPLAASLCDDPEKEDARRAGLRSCVIRRPGEPEDPAWMILALVSPNASWATGQTIPVNGGYTFAL